MLTLAEPYEWIERDLRSRFPHLADQGIEAYELATRAVASGVLASTDLSRLEILSRDRSSMLRDWAATVVGTLSNQFPSAADLLVKLVEAGRGDVAVSALAALHGSESTSLRARAIRIGLRHRSRQVRELAACKAQQFRLDDLLPELTDAAAVERDTGCRKSLEFSLALLRDGYLVEPMDSGDVYISVAGPRSIVGQTFAKELVEEKGLPELIRELRSASCF